MRKENPRTDLISRTQHNKCDLIRLVARDGFAVIDDKQDMIGRGVYVLKDKETIEKTLKKGRIESALHVKLADGFLEELLKRI